jgi:hypothetical protein
MARRWVRAATAVTLAAALVALAVVVVRARRDRPSEQVTAGPPSAPTSRASGGVEVPAEVRAQPGTPVGSAEALRPVGPLGLRGYRLDALTVDPPVAVTVNGAQVQATRAVRVTITGGPFPIRDLPGTVWVGDRNLGVGLENRTRSELSVITFDVDALADGATIAVAYGESRYELPVRVGG